MSLRRRVLFVVSIRGFIHLAPSIPGRRESCPLSLVRRDLMWKECVSSHCFLLRHTSVELSSSKEISRIRRM
ncbi:hypothetical protein Bca4012_090938 [Brassica carinata]|uniref:(rape) hypothetical protein n=1 Tax=Brassica napus TaxID=3708 RepID=A0A816RSS9_BRANA|nr:unnamed protein product [Brassica napus]